MNQHNNNDRQFEAIFKNNQDAQFIIDVESGRILDVNIAALKHLEYHRKELLDKRFTELIPPMPEAKTQKALDEIRHFGGVFTQEFLKSDGTSCIMDMTMMMIPWNCGQAFVATLRDVSERLRHEEERENLIRDLQDALDNIKTLKGLLPICANCKKIRNDDGYWQQVETYIHQHSEADFTHGICPDCAKELYPDLYDDYEEGMKKTT